MGGKRLRREGGRSRSSIRAAYAGEEIEHIVADMLKPHDHDDKDP
jgi:hypothetical protein